MAEILVKFDEPISAASGETYFAQAAGREVEGGLWEGWVEFVPTGEQGNALESGRETTQPNRTNLEYWSQGLTKVYLEGALARAISLVEGPREVRVSEPEISLFTGPGSREAPQSPARPHLRPRPILDPFEVYEQGEGILRSELTALSRDHLEAIANAYDLISAGSAFDLKPSGTAALVEAIVAGVRAGKNRTAPGSGEIRTRP